MHTWIIIFLNSLGGEPPPNTFCTWENIPQLFILIFSPSLFQLLALRPCPCRYILVTEIRPVTGYVLKANLLPRDTSSLDLMFLIHFALFILDVCQARVVCVQPASTVKVLNVMQTPECNKSSQMQCKGRNYNESLRNSWMKGHVRSSNSCLFWVN